MVYYNHVLVNSQDRVVGTSSSFLFSFNRPLENCKYLELLYASIPNTMYNITTNNNNFTFNDGVTNQTATLTPGVYTQSNFLTALATAIVATLTALTFTLTFDPIALKVTISATGAFTLLFGTGTNQIYAPLGYLQQDYGSATSRTADNVMVLSLPTNILVKISGLGNSYIASNTKDANVTFVIPVDVNSQDIIQFYRNDRYPQVVYISGQCYTQMYISLFDRDGQAISLNGAEYALIFNVIEDKLD